MTWGGLVHVYRREGWRGINKWKTQTEQGAAASPQGRWETGQTVSKNGNRRLWRDVKNSFSSKVGGRLRRTWGVDKRDLEIHRGPPASA